MPRAWPRSPSSATSPRKRCAPAKSKFRGLFEGVIEGVYQSTRDGRLVSVNSAFVKMLGYSSAEEMYALPSSVMLYWSATDRADFVRRVDSDGEVRSMEVVLRRRDGTQVVALENSRGVRDGSGRIVGYEGTVSDITERKRAEQAIFAEKDRALVTLQSIGDAVISTDANARIDYLNPVAERLTGWSVLEARGCPIGDVLQLIDESHAQSRGLYARSRAHRRRDLGAFRSHRARESPRRRARHPGNRDADPQPRGHGHRRGDRVRRRHQGTASEARAVATRPATMRSPVSSTGASSIRGSKPR